ncbi:MAG: hypothetical protein A2X81_17285 [Desulfobacterales bacterium GWB2_56_26]|nr:MAG: hypothetical protein A2X81_17285 [Desulfobacterales bacterium GWB2_56_26]
MKFVFSFIFLIAAASSVLFPTTGYCSPTDTTDSPLDLLFYSRNTPTEFIVVEKKHQKLSLFEHQDQVRLLREFVCATGQNPGTKKISGDSRTPEGIYFITEIYEDKRISVFGSRAFHLNYPNIFDSHAGHLGDGIFIHGTNKKLIPNSTNGCITLDNKDLDELAPYLAVNTIPIIVLDALSEPLVGKSLLLEADTPRFAEILGALSFDLKKIPVRDIQALSFLKQGEKAVASIKYATYERDHIQYREQLRTYLTQSPIGTWRNIYAVQSQEKNPYLLAMRPSKNELVARLAPVPQPAEASPADQPAEPPQPVQPDRSVQVAAAEATEPAATPAVQPAEPARPAKAVPAQPARIVQKTPPAKQPAVAKIPQLTRSEELLNFVEKWRSAWVAKDIETYISCYSPSFKNGGLNREGWKRKKLSLNKKYSYINVAIKNIVVQWTPSGANVSFSQTYKSDQYQTVGTKVLQMTNKNNRWQIESEIM